MAAVAVHDMRKFTKLSAVLSIIQTCVVLIVLAAGSFFLNKSIQDLVLKPIEEMIKSVKSITSNPIHAVQMSEEEIVKQEEHEKRMAMLKGRNYKPKKTTPLETEVLRDTLFKIGGLLAIGLGEAGSRLISENMRKGDDVNPLLPGQ